MLQRYKKKWKVIPFWAKKRKKSLTRACDLCNLWFKTGALFCTPCKIFPGWYITISPVLDSMLFIPLNFCYIFDGAKIELLFETCKKSNEKLINFMEGRQ
jgi:hypothetical protein